MAIVNQLVNNLINHHEVAANRFFRYDAAVITEDLHHAIENLVHHGGRDVVFSCSNEVNAKFLREKVIDAVNMLLKRV